MKITDHGKQFVVCDYVHLAAAILMLGLVPCGAVVVEQLVTGTEVNSLGLTLFNYASIVLSATAGPIGVAKWRRCLYVHEEGLAVGPFPMWPKLTHEQGVVAWRLSGRGMERKLTLVLSSGRILSFFENARNCSRLVSDLRLKQAVWAKSALELGTSAER